MRRLRRIGNPLLVVLAAPRRHQRIKRIPVGDFIGLAGKPRVLPPLGQTHYREPRHPLALLARRNGGVSITRRQDRDGGAIAVRDPLARRWLAAEAGACQLGNRHCCQRLLDRHVDDRARLGRQCRVHAGTGGGEPADERGLFADRADRRLREIVHLAGQQSGDAAGKHQSEIGGRIVGSGPGLSERRDVDNHRPPVGITESVDVAAAGAELGGPAFADEQVSHRERGWCRYYRLVVIEVCCELCRIVRIDAADIGAGIGKKPPADSRSQSAPIWTARNSSSNDISASALT